MPVPPRRRFLAACAATAVAALIRPRPAVALAARRCALAVHPTPRAGVSGARVLTRAQLADAPALVPLFDAIRLIPEVADGIGCHCGCAGSPGYYSLLSCYEGEGMARGCHVCQGQGRLTVRLRKEGKSLDEIRAAVDAQFG